MTRRNLLAAFVYEGRAFVQRCHSPRKSVDSRGSRRLCLAIYNFSSIDARSQLWQKESTHVALESQNVNSFPPPMEELEMIFNDQGLTYSADEILEQAATRMGLTPAQMEDLLESELDADQLLDYITAVVSNRMN
jgi:hypothetical protein